METGEVTRVRHGDHFEAECAGGELGHDQADNQQQDARLDVAGRGDVEGLVRTGEEEVEPGRGRKRRERACRTVPEGGYRDDHHDQDQRRVRAREIRTEGHQDERHQEGGHKARHQGEPVPERITGHHAVTSLARRDGSEPRVLVRLSGLIRCLLRSAYHQGAPPARQRAGTAPWSGPRQECPPG